MRRTEKRREVRRLRLLFYTALVGLIKVILELLLTIIKKSR